MNFLAVVPWYYRALAIVALIVTVFGAGYLKGYLHEEHKMDAFVAQVKAEGRAQIELTKKTIAAGKLSKEKADEEHARSVASFDRTIKRMRNARPSTSFVPAAPAGAKRSDLVCFDRAEYIRADGEFTSEARGLADEGSKATIDLDSAKRWALDLKMDQHLAQEK